MSSNPQLFDSYRASSPAKSRTGSRLAALPWAAIVAGLLALSFVAAQAWLQRNWLYSGPNNDFLTFYSAAGSSELYAATEPAHRPYLRPPFHAALLAPLRLLPYPSAYLLWQVLMLWCVAGFVAWWSPRSPAFALLGAAVSIPLFFAFVRGQDAALLLLASAGCVRAASLNRPFRSGLWMSLLAVQPHALLAAPVVLLAQRRWDALKGVLGGLAGLGALAFAAGGWDWPWRFAGAWTAAAPAHPETMPNLVGAVAWLGFDSRAVLPAAALLLAAVYAVCGRESFSTGLGCALAAGLLLAPRAHFEDTVLLLPAALALIADKHAWPVRLLAVLALSPLGYILQGGRDAIPAVVLMGAAMLLLAAVLPSSRPWPFRRRKLRVQFDLN